jgi:hypothetical protein
MTPTTTLPEVQEKKTIMDATPAVPSTTIAPDTKADLQLASSVVSKATQAIIITPEDHTTCGEELSTIKKRIKSLTDKRLAITRPMDEAKAQIMDLFRTPIEEYEKAKDIFNSKLIAWEDEQERIRQEKERQAQEEARKREEEERVAAAAALELEAKHLADSGNQEEADEIQKEAVKVLDTPAPVVAPRVGSSWTASKSNFTQERWSAAVTNLGLLCKAVAHESTCTELLDLAEKMPESVSKKEIISFIRKWSSTAKRAPIQAIAADQVFLNRQATSYKARLDIPGVEAKSNKTKAGR